MSDSSGIRSSALKISIFSNYFDHGSWLQVKAVALSISRLQGELDYLKPSFLYPAASAYQFANGTIHRLSQGRFVIYFASEGADMFAISQLSRSETTKEVIALPGFVARIASVVVDGPWHAGQPLPGFTANENPVTHISQYSLHSELCARRPNS